MSPLTPGLQAGQWCDEARLLPLCMANKLDCMQNSLSLRHRTSTMTRTRSPWRRHIERGERGGGGGLPGTGKAILRNDNDTT